MKLNPIKTKKNHKIKHSNTNKKTKKAHNNPLKTFIKNEKHEWRQISWPPFKESCKNFGIVCIFVVFMGMFYTGADMLISFILKVLGGVS